MVKELCTFFCKSFIVPIIISFTVNHVHDRYYCYVRKVLLEILLFVPKSDVIYATEWTTIVVYKDREILCTYKELYSYQILSLRVLSYEFIVHLS